MTRINVVPVEELTRQHLIAEYRELPRIFGLIRAAIARGERPDDRRNPLTYTLGTGHVRFFYNKVNWLAIRFRLLVADMDRRGYKATYRIPPTHGLPFRNEWNVIYRPTEADLALNRQRIFDRLQNSS